MLYNMASSHTDSQTVRGRPTLKIEIECFRNGLVRELSESKLLRESELSDRRNELLESQYSRSDIYKVLPTELEMCIKLKGQEICETGDDSSKRHFFSQVVRNKDLRSFAFCVDEAIDCQQGEGNGIYRGLVTVTGIIIILFVLLFFRSVSVFIVIFVLRVIIFHLMIYCAILYMNYSPRRDVALSASFVVRKFGDVTEVAVERNVRKESVVVEKIKEVELRSRRGQFIYYRNYDRNRLHSYSRRCYAPSRLPVKKLKSLLHKKRNVRVFVWKGIRKNTPLSSKIFGYVKSTKCWLKKNRKKNVRFFRRRSQKCVGKRRKMYLLSKYESRGFSSAMKYENKILRKYLPLCTCNFPISTYTSLNHRVNCDELKLCNDIEKNPGPSNSLVNVDAAKTISAPYCQGNVAMFGENAGQQCIAMSLCALICSKVRTINSGNDMVQIMNFGNELYTSLSMLARQSLLMFTELPAMVTLCEQTFQLEYSESYSGNINGDVVIEGYEYCMPLGRAFNTLLSLDYNLFILTVGIIGVGIYSIQDGKFKVFDSHARDVYGNSHPEGKCVLLEIPSIDNLVQYFQSLYRNQEIYELKGIHIYNFEENVCSSKLLKDSSVLKNDNFVCSCKQCSAIAFYAMCYSVINPCGYWTSRTLVSLAHNGCRLYNDMGINRHIMPVDLPSKVTISEVDINCTIYFGSSGVLCCKLSESKYILKMLISRYCDSVTGFLLWLGMYCIGCVVQKRTVKKWRRNIFSLVAYDERFSPAIRHFKGIEGIDSFVEEICKVAEMKWNCQEVPYQIQFMLCSSSVESDQRKEIVRKHWLSGVENCEMESVQKKKRVSDDMPKRQSGKGIGFCIEQFKKKIREGPYYICCVCNRLLYRRSVVMFCANKYLCQEFFTVQTSFDGRQYICKSCQSKVKVDKVPCQAVVNNMYVDEVPRELAVLEKLEQILIAQRIVFEKIVIMPKGEQRKIKGAVCNVPVECDETCAVLPRPSERSGIIMLKLKRKLEFKGHVYFQAVRPQLTHSLLEILPKNAF